MLVIGIAGGSGSGKTTVVKTIVNQLKGRVVVIPQDSYYKDSSHVPAEDRKKINFDHPDAIDWKLMCQQIRELKSGKTIEQPVYSYITCSRSTTETVTVEPADVIIVEAFASGVPVLSTAVGGIAEILSPERGILIPQGDEDALLQGMNQMLDRGSAYDRQAIRDFAIKTFAAQNIGQQMFEAYNTVVIP